MHRSLSLRALLSTLSILPVVFLTLVTPSTAQAAQSQWTDAPRPSRAEAPVPKNAETPRYKSTVSDPADDTFGSGEVQLDLQRLAAEVVGSDLVITLGFYGSISAPDSAEANALEGYIDLDLDQNGATGVVPWVDLLRADDNTTGMGNEAYVDLFSYDGKGNVELVDDSSGETLGLVPLTLGEDVARVYIPLALLGGDRSVDVAAAIGTLEETTDVAPNQGSVASSDGVSAVLLQDERFRVDVEWGDFRDNRGIGRVASQSDDSAIFYFFSPANWELLVKVLDGCTVNDNFWVFVSGATNVEYTVVVTDTISGQEAVYSNGLGTRAVTVTDTEAFATCP